MKKFGKIAAIAASSALALTMGIALAGCSSEPKDYVFEAEEAVLTDADGMDEANTMKLQPSAEGSDETYTLVSYFSTEGQTITWNVKSSKDCEVTLKLRASSCMFGVFDEAGNDVMGTLMGSMWGGALPEGFDITKCKPVVGEIDGGDIALSVNGTAVTLAGKLPKTELPNLTSVWEMFNMYSTVNLGEVTATVQLKKGDNKIELEVTQGCGYNVDKITVNSEAKLTFNKTDNSDRLPATEDEE